MFSDRSFNWTRRSLGVTLTFIAASISMAAWLPAQDAATAPAFTPPPLSPSLLDFVTGLPVAYKTKLLFTPKLLRPPFAGAPVDTVKGLASKIKAQQLDAKNRIKAAEFLGTVDCVAYPESQEQLVSLVQEDPSEKVRLAAAKALKEQFARGHDRKPNKKEKRRFDQCRGCCPGQEVMNALAKRAYEYDDSGCPLEPSRRVRRAIADALDQCCIDYCEHLSYPTDESVSPEPVEEEAVPQTEEEQGEKPTEEKRQPPPETPPAEDPGRQAQQPVQPKVQPVSCEEHYPEVACLRGFCPVAMQEHKLIPASDEFTSTWAGHMYRFSSAEAKADFDSNPQKFAPVQGGVDLVVLKQTGQKVPGSYFDYYEGRPYWFTSRENRNEFLKHPQQYVKEGF